MKKIYTKPTSEVIKLRQEGFLETSPVKLKRSGKVEVDNEETCILSNKRYEFLNDLWKIN